MSMELARNLYTKMPDMFAKARKKFGRKSSDQSVLATPRSLSQPATSFIASQCQGIRQTPLLCLISRFVSEVTISSDRHIGSFRAGDEPHTTALITYPFLPPCL